MVKDLYAGNALHHNITKRIYEKRAAVEEWLEMEEKKFPPLPYTSIDLRDSGFKVSPVDSNAFPAGFNNICKEDWEVAAKAFLEILTVKEKKAKRIIVIPENHTKNQAYFENLSALKEILTLSGFEIIFGHLNPAMKENSLKGITKIETSFSSPILLERIYRKEDYLFTEREKFEEEDLILLNNDLTNGIPKELLNIKHKIVPPTNMGWFQRKKGNYLKTYEGLAEKLASIIDIDPFQITALHDEIEDINFLTGKGIDRLASATDNLLRKIEENYKERNITSKPFVFIKHNSGTYGRSIMSVESGEEIYSMNRKKKDKMHTGKGGKKVHSLILMEGIPTNISEQGESAEPVIYLAGHKPIGGFLRLHSQKGSRENLNSPGSHFRTLCFANIFRYDTPMAAVLERFYGILGRLSSLANAQEMEKSSLFKEKSLYLKKEKYSRVQEYD